MYAVTLGLGLATQHACCHPQPPSYEIPCGPRSTFFSLPLANPSPICCPGLPLVHLVVSITVVYGQVNVRQLNPF